MTSHIMYKYPKLVHHTIGVSQCLSICGRLIAYSSFNTEDTGYLDDRYKFDLYSSLGTGCSLVGIQYRDFMDSITRYREYLLYLKSVGIGTMMTYTYGDTGKAKFYSWEVIPNIVNVVIPNNYLRGKELNLNKFTGMQVLTKVNYIFPVSSADDVSRVYRELERANANPGSGYVFPYDVGAYDAAIRSIESGLSVLYPQFTPSHDEPSFSLGFPVVTAPGSA